MKQEVLGLVSIGIPTYNGAEFLREALNSALHQTYRNIEIIVSDDRSTDETLQILEEFKKKSEVPFKVFHHEPSTIGANWNNCLKHCEGEFIKFLFQDDLLAPDCVSRLMSVSRATTSDSKLRLVFCRRGLIGNTMNVVDPLENLYEEYSSVIYRDDILGRADLYEHPRNKIGEPVAVMFHRSLLQEVGDFNEQLKQALDYEYWYRVVAKYPIGYVDEELVQFRIHDLQTTKSNKRDIILDTYLIPSLFLSEYKQFLHPKVIKILSFKRISGYILFKIVRPLIHLFHYRK